MPHTAHLFLDWDNKSLRVFSRDRMDNRRVLSLFKYSTWLLKKFIEYSKESSCCFNLSSSSRTDFLWSSSSCIFFFRSTIFWIVLYLSSDNSSISSMILSKSLLRLSKRIFNNLEFLACGSSFISLFSYSFSICFLIIEVSSSGLSTGTISVSYTHLTLPTKA